MCNKQIKVGARQYEVFYFDNLEFNALLLKLGASEDEIIKARSFIDYDSQHIVIRNQLRDDHKKELLIHELLHACLEDAGVTQDFEAEKFISAISPRLNQLLIDNEL